MTAPPRPFPSIVTVINSFDTPALTQRAYEGITRNSGTHVVVLDHSSRGELVFDSPYTIDLGRDMPSYGDWLDLVVAEPQFRAYDYVGLWCNDVFDIPPDLVTRMFTAVAAWPRPVGLVSAAIVKGGSPHPHMARRGDGLRRVPFVETIAPYVHSSLLPTFERLSPTPSMGWGPDLVYSGVARMLGYDVLVFDSAELGHVINGGAFREVGRLDEHGRIAPREACAWITRNDAWAAAATASENAAAWLLSFDPEIRPDDDTAISTAAPPMPAPVAVGRRPGTPAGRHGHGATRARTRRRHHKQP